jgi:hypothetical protein
MVQRIESAGKLEQMEGVVESVDLEKSALGTAQYHIKIKPTNVEVKGSTGVFHEWIPMSRTATEEQVPQGSVMERYLTQVEICVPAAKRVPTIKQALAMLIGKKFRFQRLKLGKDFEGNPAREYFVPVVAL